VFFDLDDTLFDNSFSVGAGLDAVREALPAFRARELDELSQLHCHLLETLHTRVLLGELTLHQARVARFAALCRACGLEEERAGSVAEMYRAAYQRARRAVPGARELLSALRGRVVIGVITHNVVEEQLAKLDALDLRGLVDVLVVSEEAGVAKPDPAIFRIALDRARCRPEHAVMVGDSWTVDIAGARAAGIRPVWLNRWSSSESAAEPCAQVPSLLPTDELLRLLIAGEGA
jgi:HAD superfamily hydrolase (TIGR01549 family)